MYRKRYVTTFLDGAPVKEKSECRQVWEAEFYAGMSHPSEWSKETTEHVELCFRLFERGWHAALEANAATKPVAWVRYRSDGGIEGPILDSDSRMCDTRRSFWTPLHTATVFSNGRRAGKRHARDKELLRLAAQAAGAEWSDYSDKTPDHWTIKHSDGVWREWAPLDRDADADRLAVSLGAVVTNAGTYTAAQLGDQLCVETHYEDAPAARRRAIVGIAAMHTIKQQNAPENQL